MHISLDGEKPNSAPLACRGCDLVQCLPPLPAGTKARCPRCSEVLATAPRDPLDRPLALTIAAAIVFAIANTTPLMRLSASGREVTTTLIGGAQQMWLQGHEPIALAVAFCAVVAPASYIALLLIVLFAVRRPPAPRWVGGVLRWTELARPWSMTEVMMLGILVTLTKLSQLATVTPGVAMYAVGILIVLLARITIDLSPREYWQRVTWVGPRPDAADNSIPSLAKETSASPTAQITSAHAGLVSCTTCGLLSRPLEAAAPGHCARCGTRLASRRPDSVQRTWALLIAAAICYVPANLLPVLTSSSLGSTDSDTIMSGVAYLYASGSWPLALIVLVASVMIPIGKIVAIGTLLIAARRGASGAATTTHALARLYRMVEFIGRWSMLDVFADTFIVALVQLPPLMSEQAGPGVVFFMAVVVLTMLAAQSFDPRLLWDRDPARSKFLRCL